MTQRFVSVYFSKSSENKKKSRESENPKKLNHLTCPQFPILLLERETLYDRIRGYQRRDPFLTQIKPEWDDNYSDQDKMEQTKFHPVLKEVGLV